MSVFIKDGPIAICDRCRFKFLHRELSPDRDSPGLMVCKDCNDQPDPWRLPFTPRDANIAVPRARPETPIAGDVVSQVNASGTVVDVPIYKGAAVAPAYDYAMTAAAGAFGLSAPDIVLTHA